MYIIIDYTLMINGCPRVYYTVLSNLGIGLYYGILHDNRSVAYCGGWRNNGFRMDSSGIFYIITL